MTDPTDAPPPETPPPDIAPADAEPPPPSPAQRRHVLPWLIALGFVILAGTQLALWYVVGNRPSPTAALEQRVQAVETRVTRLEQRPAVPQASLAPLEARVAALEHAPGPAAVQSAPPPPAASPAQLDALAQRVDSDETRLAALEKAASVPAEVAARAARIARVQAALVALAAGRPLGSIPDAPPALARYATVAPPTEAALRLSFPAAADAARAAGPAPSAGRWLDRIWGRVRDLVTVRQGAHILVGDPNAGVLQHAQSALDAGDLAGAVADVEALHGPAAQSMAAWRDQAAGLLAARAALADLAAHA